MNSFHYEMKEWTCDQIRYSISLLRISMITFIFHLYHFGIIEIEKAVFLLYRGEYNITSMCGYNVGLPDELWDLHVGLHMRQLTLSIFHASLPSCSSKCFIHLLSLLSEKDGDRNVNRLVDRPIMR